MAERHGCYTSEEIELTYGIDRSVVLSNTADLFTDLEALLELARPLSLEPRFSISESLHLFFANQDLHSYIRMKLKSGKKAGRIRAVVEEKTFLTDTKTETALFKTKNLTEADLQHLIHTYGPICGILNKRSCKLNATSETLARGLKFIRIDQVRPVTTKLALGSKMETHLELEFHKMSYMRELKEDIENNAALSRIVGQHKRKLASLERPFTQFDDLWGFAMGILKPIVTVKGFEGG